MGVIGEERIREISFLLASIVLFGPGLVFFLKGIPSLLRRPARHELARRAGHAQRLSAIRSSPPSRPHVLPAGTVNVYYEAAVVIVTLILFGRYLEARAKGRTSEAIRALARLQPKTARVERDGATVDVDIDDVRVGDIVLVRPGERIPRMAW